MLIQEQGIRAVLQIYAALPGAGLPPDRFEAKQDVDDLLRQKFANGDTFYPVRKYFGFMSKL